MHSIANKRGYKHLIHDKHAQLDLIHVDDVCRIFSRMAQTNIHHLIEQECQRGQFDLPPVYNVWHDGVFRISLKDFTQIAAGMRTEHPEIVHDKINSTMQWYHENSHG